MTEDEARQRILAALHEINAPDERETTAGYENQVDYHIDNIRDASDGGWNELLAQDYVRNLEQQIEQEMQAPDTITTKEEP